MLFGDDILAHVSMLILSMMMRWRVRGMSHFILIDDDAVTNSVLPVLLHSIYNAAAAARRALRAFGRPGTVGAQLCVSFGNV